MMEPDDSCHVLQHVWFSLRDVPILVQALASVKVVAQEHLTAIAKGGLYIETEATTDGWDIYT